MVFLDEDQLPSDTANQLKASGHEDRRVVSLSFKPAYDERAYPEKAAKAKADLGGH